MTRISAIGSTGGTGADKPRQEVHRLWGLTQKQYDDTVGQLPDEQRRQANALLISRPQIAANFAVRPTHAMRVGIEHLPDDCKAKIAECVPSALRTITVEDQIRQLLNDPIILSLAGAAQAICSLLDEDDERRDDGEFTVNELV